MKFKYLLLLAGFLLSTAAYADDAMSAESVLTIIQSAMVPAINKLSARAIGWLGAFAALQFFMTNYSLLKSDADIQTVIAKAVGAIAWVGICAYIINNGPQFISDVGGEMFDLLGISLPSPGSIMISTTGLAATLAAIAVAVGGVGIIGSNTAGSLIIIVLLVILAVGMFFACKIFMIQLELGLIVMLSPLSFSFLGLNALKDQGIAPFKALISLSYRIILMTLIMSAFTQVNSVASNAISSLTASSITDGIGNAINVILAALGAYLVLAYLFFKSDSVAATLASGGTSMGTGDIASAAAAGAAAGAAIASGGLAAAGATGGMPQAMSDFVRGLQGGGSVSNASSSGLGGASAGSLLGGAPPPPPPLASMGDAASAFKTASNGAPLPPEGAALPDASSIGPNVDSPNSSSSSAAGSGMDAGISGGGSSTDQRIDKLVDALSNQSQGKNWKDHLANTNQHVSQERAATHVSVNTHHSD